MDAIMVRTMAATKKTEESNSGIRPAGYPRRAHRLRIRPRTGGTRTQAKIFQRLLPAQKRKRRKAPHAGGHPHPGTNRRDEAARRKKWEDYNREYQREYQRKKAREKREAKAAEMETAAAQTKTA